MNVQDSAENYRTGYVKIYRSLFNNPALKDTRPYTREMAFIWMVMRANFEDTVIYIDHIRVELKRGQFVTSQKSMEEAFRWKRHEVRTFLERLKIEQMVHHKSANKYTMLTVCKYDSYNAVSPTTRQQTANGTPTTRQRPTTDKEVNTVKEVKKEINIVEGFKVPKDFFKAEPDSQARYLKFQERLRDDYPQVYALKPISIEVAKSLYLKYGQEMFWAKVSGMENKPNLGKEYSDFGLTIKNWLSKEKTLIQQAAIDNASRFHG